MTIRPASISARMSRSESSTWHPTAARSAMWRMTFHRYVALGDSFTEGVGDPDPTAPTACAAGPTGSPRCWPQRPTTSATPTSPSAAASSARSSPSRSTRRSPSSPTWSRSTPAPTTCSVRGRHRRPRRGRTTTRSRRLTATGAQVVCSPSSTPAPAVYGPMRGRMAIFNELGPRDRRPPRRDVVDMWRMREQRDCRRDGHRPDAPQQPGRHQIALARPRRLGVEHEPRAAPRDRRSAPRPRAPEHLGANAEWTREPRPPGCTAA